MTRSGVQVAWLIGIILWAMVCSAGWFVATRGDYARLNAATACLSATKIEHPAGVDCTKVRHLDLRTAKAAIDRKATISRLASALGAAIALGLWFLLGRPGLERRH